MLATQKMFSTQFDDRCSDLDAEKEVEDTVFHNDKKRMV